MTNNALYKKITTETKINKDLVAIVMESFKKITTETLKNKDSITLTNFGVFNANIRNGRENSVTPQNKQIKIPSMYTVKFTPAKKLKNIMKSIPVK